MDYNEYMSTISNVQEVKLGESDLKHFQHLLLYEINKGPFSVYKIYSYYKKTLQESYAYKNIHQKTQKLLSLGLIEEIEGPHPRGAKFYRLSVNGWFNLIMNRTFLSSPFEKAIIKFFHKNIFFKTFLYPYFEPKTMEYYLKIRRTIFISYLEYCCGWTLACFDPAKESKVKEKILIHGLDMKVRSFLFELAMDTASTYIRYPSKRTLEILSNLSHDGRFREALKDAKEEFEKSYEVLTGLRGKEVT